MSLRLLRVGLFLLLLGALSDRAWGLSLSVIPNDQAASSAVDVLTAGLSRSTNITLLERAAWDKIMAEQKLSLSRPGDLLNAGKLAGADCVLVVEHAEKSASAAEKPAETLALRLVSVRHGILLHNFEFKWPVADLVDWSAQIGQELQPHLSRAQLPADGQLKVSLLNFKSAIESRESRLLDRELNSLLIKRLLAEKNIFVLERQKLGATFLERDLNSESSPFWSGSLLVEGVVNKLGFSTNEITLEGRVGKPGEATPKIIALKRKPSELPALIDDLVREILKVQSHSSSVEFNPATEAERYFKEATWALRWGLWPEAQAASDAAWALGKQDFAAANLRVLASVRAARTDWGNTQTFPQRRRRQFQKLPDPAALDHLVAALSIYLETSIRTTPSLADTNKVWIGSGVEALKAASQLLFHYYYTPEARLGVEPGLKELRELCREVSAWMLKLPSVRAPYFLDGPGRLTLDEARSVLEGNHPIRIMAEHGALWQERPRDGLEMHRMLIKASSFGTIRDSYLSKDHLPLAGWSWEERKMVIPLWRSFLTNVPPESTMVERVEFSILQASCPQSDAELRAQIYKIADLIATNATSLATHPSPLSFQGLGSRLLQLGSNIVTPERDELEKKLSEYYEPIFNGIYTGQFTHQAKREAESARERLLPAQRAFLEARKLEMSEFFRIMPREPIDLSTATNLLPLVADYTAYYSNVYATAESPQKIRIQSALFHLSFLQQRLNGVINPPAAVVQTNLVGSSAAASRGQATLLSRAGPGLGRPMALPPQSPPGGAESVKLPTNSIKVEAFLRFAIPGADRASGMGMQVSSFKVHNSQLWARVSYQYQTGHFLSPPSYYDALVAFSTDRSDPPTIVQLTDTRFHHGSIFQPPATYDFAEKSLYMPGTKELQKYDLTSKTWSSLNIPMASASHLTVIGGEIYALSTNTLLRINPKEGSVGTLASTRREPPVSPMDGLNDFSQVVLAPGRLGLRVLAGQRVYEVAGTDFKSVFTFKNRGRGVRLGDSLLYSETEGPEQTVTYLLAPGSSTPEALFRQRSRYSMPQHFYRSWEQENETAVKTTWGNTEPVLFLPESSLELEGGDFLMFGEPAPKPRTASDSGQLPQMNLFFFSRQRSMPIVLTPEFPTGSPSFLDSRHLFFSRLNMAATDHAILVGHGEAVGAWIITKSELKRAVANAGEPATPIIPSPRSQP